MSGSPRPQTLDDYIGQDRLKRRLDMAMLSAMARGKPLPSTLLLGPPGIGKTSLAFIMANTMNEEIEAHITASMKQGTLIEIVNDFDGVLFLDEIHGAPPKRQETLLPLLEDGYVMSMTGEKIHAKRLTIVAATTEGDKVIRPLYDRFMIRPPFEPYTTDQMTEITKQMAGFEGIVVEDDWAEAVGQAALGLPRYARALVEVARDLLTVVGKLPEPETVLSEANVTDTGLTRDHIQYLETLKMAGGVAGVETLRQLVGMPRGHIEFLEVDLIKQGMILRTKGGRELTGPGRAVVKDNT